MQFKSLTYLATIVTIVLGSTVQDILNDLVSLKTSITNLDDSINNFPAIGGSVPQALAIHLVSLSVESGLTITTTDTRNVSPSPVTEADGETILAAINAIVPIVEHALTGVVQKQSIFAPLGVSAIVLQDLQTLNTDTQALEQALTAAAPPDLVDQANSISDTINAAFANAIAAYSPRR